MKFKMLKNHSRGSVGRSPASRFGVHLFIMSLLSPRVFGYLILSALYIEKLALGNGGQHFKSKLRLPILQAANTQRDAIPGVQVNGRGHVRTFSPYRCDSSSPELRRVKHPFAGPLECHRKGLL